MKKEARVEVEYVRPPMWKSRALAAAFLVTTVGLALWIFASVTAPDVAAPPSDPNIVQGLTAGERPSPDAPAERRFIDDAGPILAKLGGSFLIGFVAAYLFKKIVSGLLILLIVLALGAIGLDLLNVVDIPWMDARDRAMEGVDWIKGEASRIRDFLQGVVPAAIAFAVGAFFGLRFG